MISIDQLLESVGLDLEPRWVTKDEDGEITIFSHRPTAEKWCSEWRAYEGDCKTFGELKLSEFKNKRWTECIYEVPRWNNPDGQILKLQEDSYYNVHLDVLKKINELVGYVNALIESNNIHEKQIDELQMKLEPEKCAVNELKGAKNE